MSAEKVPQEKEPKTAISFKELVTGVLALFIIIYTLILLWPHLSTSPIDNTSAESIFSILGGWGGIILGYYFGRLPSEKAATQAQKTAAQAEKTKEEAKTEYDELINEYQNKLNDYKKIFEEIIAKSKA